MTNFAGQMPSAVSPKTSCSQTSYLPSAIEKKFKLNAVQLTKDRHVLCGALKGTTEEWLAMNLKKTPATSKSDIFSQICPGPMATKQVIEPLVGLLRDPRFLCLKKPELFTFSVDWLVLADNKKFPIYNIQQFAPYFLRCRWVEICRRFELFCHQIRRKRH